jgi:multidrug efflux pump subunit AcrA (membrane-fusion protein)
MSQPAANAPDPLDRESALLPKDAPARVARWTGWLLLALAAVAAAFATVFRLPETVVAPFVLVPAEGTDPLRAPQAGELAVVRVQAGQSVKLGEELFQIRSDDIRNGHARLRQLSEDERALAERVRKLDDSLVTELAIKDAELVQAERELTFRDQHLATVRDLLGRAERLVADGLLSQVELLGHQLDAAESEKDRVLTEKLRQQLALQRQDRMTARARARIDEQAEAEKLRVQLTTLRAQLADSAGDVKSVRAPYDAVVLSVSQRTPGGVVNTGVELCQLARPEARPRAQLMLPESGVPKLRLGQPVRLFLAAFPYQRHGTVSATLTWVSPASVKADGEPHFIALTDLQTGDTPSLPLRIGMNGEARILTGRRTLLERALEPLRAMRERAFVE